MANGKWQMANGKWQMANGKWQMAKCKRVLRAFGLVFLIFLIFSCSLNNSEISDTTITNKVEIDDDSIPYASLTELEQACESNEILNYKLVRSLLKIDYEIGLKGAYEWEGAQISEKPVIIYDSKSKPEYYEFIVKSDSKAIGTITTYATRKSTNVVSYVIPWVRDYTTYLTKANEYSLFSEGYPTRMVCGLLGKAGYGPSIAVDLNTGVTVELSEDANEQTIIEEMENYTAEELEEMGLENWQEELLSMEEEIQEKEDDATEFWTAVEEYQENFLTLTDEEIEEEYNQTKWTDYNYSTSFDSFILPKYSSSRIQYTLWAGMCFPSAMCWFYRGLYSTYDGTYLPLYGDVGFHKDPYRQANTPSYYRLLNIGDNDNDGILNSFDADWVKTQSQNADGGLYYDITAMTDFYKNGEGGVNVLMYGSSVVEKITENSYSTYTTLLHSTMHNNIRNKKLPIFIFKSGHVMIGFGSKYEIEHWTRKYSFIWWSWTSNKSKIVNKYWLIQDNGNKTEFNNCLPFWSNDDNYNWSLHLRIVKK